MALSKEYFKAYNYRGKVIDVSGVIGHLERGDLLSARKYLGSKKLIQVLLKPLSLKQICTY